MPPGWVRQEQSGSCSATRRAESPNVCTTCLHFNAGDAQPVRQHFYADTIAASCVRPHARVARDEQQRRTRQEKTSSEPRCFILLLGIMRTEEQLLVSSDVDACGVMGQEHVCEFVHHVTRLASNRMRGIHDDEIAVRAETERNR